MRPGERPPRSYALEIQKLKGRPARIAALARVPAWCRELVRKHVENYFEGRRWKRRRPRHA